jgi:phosphonate transport system substrate-binding protein
LTVGVAPYLSTRTLLTVYKPIQAHLQGRFGTQVEVFTATDFRVFYQHAVEGEYDLAIMPAHFARLAQREHGFVPLVRYTSGGRGLLVTKRGTGIAKADDLRGKVVAAPDRLALGAIVVFDWMRVHGLRPEHDFVVFQTPSFNSAMHALENGEAVAAVTAPAALAQMAPALHNDIRLIVDTGEFPNLVFLAHPRLAPRARAQLKAALLGFARETSAGKRFFAETGFGDFVEVAPEDLRSLDLYLAETKRLLSLPHASR